MNPNISFTGLLVVVLAALMVPIGLALSPLRRLPAVTGPIVHKQAVLESNAS